MLIGAKQGIYKPKSMLSITTILYNPYSMSRELGIPEWKSSIQSEHNALIENGTWDLVPKPTDRKIIGLK